MIDLRDLLAEDSGQLLAWRREPEVIRWMSDQPSDTEAGHRRWFEDFLADPDRRGWIILRNGAPAGFLTLTGLTNCNRRAEWGWYIGDPDARGRGVGRAAQALGLDKAFDELGLEVIRLEITRTDSFGEHHGALAMCAWVIGRHDYLRHIPLLRDLLPPFQRDIRAFLRL